jgi:hypothetical protein
LLCLIFISTRLLEVHYEFCQKARIKLFNKALWCKWLGCEPTTKKVEKGKFHVCLGYSGLAALWSVVFFNRIIGPLDAVIFISHLYLGGTKGV